MRTSAKTAIFPSGGTYVFRKRRSPGGALNASGVASAVQIQVAARKAVVSVPKSAAWRFAKAGDESWRAIGVL